MSFRLHSRARARNRFISIFLLIAVLTLLPNCTGAPSGPVPAAKPTPAPPAPVAAPTPPPPPEVRWPTFHGSTALDGVADVALPDALTQRWRFDAGAPIANPPVAEKDRICFANTKGFIFALDLDGNQVWSKPFTEPLGEGKPPRTVYFDAPLVLLDSTLIAASAMGTVYALDSATGNLRWQTETKAAFLGSPNVAEVTVAGKPQRRVFLIDEAGGALLCLDFNTGALVWKGDGVSRCDGSPAANGQFVAYGSCAAAIHVFSAVDGKLLRETPLDDDSQIACGAVMLGNSIYAGSRSGMFVHANVETGAMVWTNKDCEGESYSTPAVSAEYIVYGANDGVLYALDRASGALKWKQKLGDTPNSPAIARGTIVVTAGGSLYLLRLTDGATLWSFDISDVVTAPSIAGALVLVGSDDGSLTAFGAKGPEQL